MRRVPAALAALVLLCLCLLPLWLAPGRDSAVAQGNAPREALEKAVSALQNQGQAISAYAVFRAPTEGAYGKRRQDITLQNRPFGAAPALRAGRMLLEDDYAKGSPLALVSDSLAAFLFGSVDCVGQPVTVQGERLVVAGVYHAGGFSPLDFSRAKGDTVYTSYPFQYTESYLAARCPKGQPVRALTAAMERLLAAGGIEGFVFSPVGERAENLCFWLVLYAGLWAAWLAGKAALFFGKKLPVQKAKKLALLAGAAVLAALVWASPFSFSLSPDIAAALEGGGSLLQAALKGLRSASAMARLNDDGTLMLNSAQKIAGWGVCCHGWLILWRQRARGR